MRRKLTADLVDTNLDEEIELIARCVVAARTATGHLTPIEVDDLLGVIGTDRQPDGVAEPHIA
ncbi:MAG: hypothetical protein ACK5MP_09050 [Nostocoides sp.]